MKLNGDYQRKYILLEIDDKADQGIIIDALKEHIAKLTKDIESYSKSEAFVRADDIPRIATSVAKCMKWRDNIHIMGSDTWIRDFDFYKNGIEKII
jgi:hypothetical protein